jgi:hypothetical protein
MDNNILIIAGMHGSGSSRVTQWLSRCGLHAGHHRVKNGVGHEDGHHKDLDFCNFHRSILSAIDLPDSGFIETVVHGMTSRERAVAAEMIAAKNRNTRTWGWNDPKTCLFLNDYKDLIPDAKYLIIFRDFESTVKALINRHFDERSQDDEPTGKFGFLQRFRLSQERKRRIREIAQEQAAAYLKVWLMYNREILKFINRVSADRYVVLDYETLLKEDLDILTLLNQEWDLSLDEVRFRTVFTPGIIGSELKIKEYVPEWIYQEATDISARLKKLAAVATQSA